MRRPVPPEIPQVILHRYAAGELTAADVGRLCGMSASTALKRLRAAGLDTSKRTRFRFRKGAPGPVTISPGLLARYKRGELTMYDVARVCGVSPAVALRELRRAGADTRKGARLRLRYWRRPGVMARVRAILRLHRKGHSPAHIGRAVGLSGTGVRYTLARVGALPPRPAQDARA